MPTAETQELFRLAEFVLMQLAAMLAEQTDSDVQIRLVITHE